MHNHVQFSYGKKVRTKKKVYRCGGKEGKDNKNERREEKEFFQHDVRTRNRGEDFLVAI